MIRFVEDSFIHPAQKRNPENVTGNVISEGEKEATIKPPQSLLIAKG
jgi:hypothetical protein